MTTPNFFIVGAPKCGTTALSEYLRAHPQVFMSTPKEPHYFAHDFPHYKKTVPTLESYLALFDDAPAEAKAVGEASVWYLYSREALKAVREFAPNARVIVMLRNPVQLAQSIHSQLVWVLDEDVKDFATAWKLQDERRQGDSIPTGCREPAFLRYGEVAKLGKQLRRLFDIFPSDQIKVLFLDDLKRDARGVYLEVLEFLGLDDDGRKEFPRINENKFNRSRLVARLTHRMPRWLASTLNNVKRVLGIKQLGWRQRLQSLNAAVAVREEIDEDLHRELVDYYRDDIALLEKLTGRNLSDWLEPRAAKGDAEAELSHGASA